MAIFRIFPLILSPPSYSFLFYRKYGPNPLVWASIPLSVSPSHLSLCCLVLFHHLRITFCLSTPPTTSYLCVVCVHPSTPYLFVVTLQSTPANSVLCLSIPYLCVLSIHPLPLCCVSPPLTSVLCLSIPYLSVVSLHPLPMC